ncbi:hypothetical protein Z043_102207 [Scleropages formosus]|uniref:Uncharacterized protein n=1 Tax=Scleropages formosus TaxID=113540 RepID=A0A0N8K2P3_SCLFO|nr:hypothetical protein Z043_102207 [Scleropages formosus]
MAGSAGARCVAGLLFKLWLGCLVMDWRPVLGASSLPSALCPVLPGEAPAHRGPARDKRLLTTDGRDPMAGRLLKVSSVATAVFASSGFYLYGKHVDLSNISIIRFGRAALTTAVISYDYITSLQSVQYGSEEYWALKSKVRQTVLVLHLPDG